MKDTRKRSMRFMALAAVAALALTACGGDDDTGGEASETTGGEATTSAPADGGSTQASGDCTAPTTWSVDSELIT